MNKVSAGAQASHAARGSLSRFGKRELATRRNVRWIAWVLAIALLALAALVLEAQPQAAGGQAVGGVKHRRRQPLRYKARKGQPLTVITPNDPAFDQEMAASFPRYLGLQKYPGMRPYLVILRNDTPRTARAYHVVWHTQTADPDAEGGIADVKLGEQSSITTPLQLRRPGGIWQNDRSIPPGGARLLSPVFNGGSADAANFGFFHNAAAGLPDPATYSGIQAELDCVVYGDGTFAGPNKSRLLLRYLVARDAQHDEALSVLRRLRSSPKDPELKNVLDLRTKIGSADKFPNRRAVPLYIHARGVSAQEFQQILTHDGYDKLRQTVEELVALMPPHEQASALGSHYHTSKFRLNGQSVSPMD